MASDKKKIIIVNNNMKIGGVQKSLCNLLWELERANCYDVSLVLFSPVGEYMDNIPQNVKCIFPKGLFRYLGVSQGETRGADVLKRGFLAAISKTFGRPYAIHLMRLSQRKLPDEYDCAIAFLHNGRNKSFFGGVQDFVLSCINAKKKIAFIHDDYNKCGANHTANNKMIAKFDKIVACSDGCRAVFEAALPHLAQKSYTVRNCNNIQEIHMLANADPVVYDNDCINVVCAVRFSPRKGVDRAIKAVEMARNRGVRVVLHILGSGILEKELKDMVVSLALEKNILFHGEQKNPYRYLKNADLFLLTSYHEAAPMVIDESYILGVPVLVTRTNSSDEMVTVRNCGWVCENHQEDLNSMFCDVLENADKLASMKASLQAREPNNDKAMSQFYDAVEKW